MLKACVPPAVPGIAFLSGGQSDVDATAHLDAMNKIGNVPWKLTFSYGRALQAAPQKAWSGKAENVGAAQAAFAHRAEMNGLASTRQMVDRSGEAGRLSGYRASAYGVGGWSGTAGSKRSAGGCPADGCAAGAGSADRRRLAGKRGRGPVDQLGLELGERLVERIHISLRVGALGRRGGLEGARVDDLAVLVDELGDEVDIGGSALEAVEIWKRLMSMIS